MATLAVLIALVALAAALRWWSLGAYGDGLDVPHPHSGAEASVTSLQQGRFFGGFQRYVEFSITSSAHEVVATGRVNLPSTGHGLSLRSGGKVEWVEDDLVQVTCPSGDFAGGEFRMQIRVPRHSTE